MSLRDQRESLERLQKRLDDHIAENRGTKVGQGVTSTWTNSASTFIGQDGTATTHDGDEPVEGCNCNHCTTTRAERKAQYQLNQDDPGMPGCTCDPCEAIREKEGWNPAPRTEAEQLTAKLRAKYAKTVVDGCQCRFCKFGSGATKAMHDDGPCSCECHEDKWCAVHKLVRKNQRLADAQKALEVQAKADKMQKALDHAANEAKEEAAQEMRESLEYEKYMRNKNHEKLQRYIGEVSRMSQRQAKDARTMRRLRRYRATNRWISVASLLIAATGGGWLAWLNIADPPTIPVSAPVMNEFVIDMSGEFVPPLPKDKDKHARPSVAGGGVYPVLPNASTTSRGWYGRTRGTRNYGY